MADERDNQNIGYKVPLTSSPYNVNYGQASFGVVRGTGADWFGPLNPMNPTAPPDVKGRIFDYMSGYNLNMRPKTEATNGRDVNAVTFDMLRSFADSYDLMRLVIETRKDQMARLEWNITTRKHVKATDKKKYEDRILEIQKFFLRPDQVNFWGDWLRLLLEDLLVIDAPTIHIRRTYGGDLYSLEPLDGATIKRVIDDWGRTPLPPVAAYQQVLKGYPAVNYTTEELIYRPRNVRTHRVYGYSPVEQILMTINIALRRQTWQLQTFTEGNIPEALIGTPSTWTPDQIAAFQNWFDSMLEGNTAERSRAKFVPGEISKGYVATEKGELFGQAEEWLARVVCYAFSISPQPFLQMMNRATAETAQETAASEGLAPMMQWVKGVMDSILIDLWHEPDLEFSFLDEDELDPDKKSQILDRDTGNGRMTINESRIASGQEPYPEPDFDRPMFRTASGYVPIVQTPEEKAEAERMRAQIAGEVPPEGEEDPDSAAGEDGEVSPDDAAPGRGVSVPPGAADTSESLGKADGPTEAQIRAGNYKKGHVKFQGLNISVENELGSIRRGRDKDGNAWEVRMPAAYGYVKRTMGADGDQVDVFIGPDENATYAYIIDQHHHETGDFDEHKVMLGFQSYDSAVQTYCAAFSDGKGKDRIGSVTTVTIDKFKSWLKGDTTASAFRKFDSPEVAEKSDRPFGLSKADAAKADAAKGGWETDSDAVANGGVNADRKFAAKREKALKRLFSAVLAKAGKSVAEQVEALLKDKGLAKADNPDLDALIDELDLAILLTSQDELEEFIQEVYEDSAKIALSIVGTPRGDDLVEQVYDRAVIWARSHAADLLGINPDSELSITDSTRDMVRATIASGLDDNLSALDIAKQLQDSYAFSEERAELIAFTEITSANSEGALDGYREAEAAGIEMKKSWLMLEDACGVCSANAAQGAIPLDEEFSSGDMAPGAHPKCRCVLVPEVGEIN